jgi:SNF2 family DNA or RNA helicase
MLKKEQLHSYQNKAIDFITNKKNVALFLGMGLGKTISTLTAIEDLKYNSFDVNKVLIIAPLRVCNTVWMQEAQKWEHTKDLTFSNLAGGKVAMREGLKKEADIYLINRENVVALVEHLGKDWMFDMMVIDESSSFKSPSSKRFKALKKVISKINYTVLLTGTPSPNGYMDLWSQIYLLDMGRRLGVNITAYRNRYFNRDYMGYSYELRYGAVKNIQDKIKDIVLSMSAKDYLELPKVISTVQYQEMPKKLLATYNKFKNDMVFNLENEEKITAMSAATLTNKLLQFCSGNMYDEDENIHNIHTLKIDMLKEIVEDNPNDTFLVAYNYKHELADLQKHFKYAKVLDKSAKTVEKWNKGEIRMLLVQPMSAGHGINLQYGGNNIVWYGFTWSLELYQQLNARLDRQGQTKPVNITHLAVGDIENKLMQTLTQKDISQSNLLRALK